MTVSLPDVLSETKLLELSQTASRSGVVVCEEGPDGDYPITYASPGFERLTGYRRDEILGRDCRFLQDAQTDPLAVDRLRRAIADGRRVTVTMRNVRRDGTPFWNELTVTPLVEDGSVRQYVGVQVDVTDRHEAELRAAAFLGADPVTGLVRGETLLAALDDAVVDALAQGRQLALVAVQLDGLSGADVRVASGDADAALAETAERLRAAVRGADVVARRGHDRFLVLLGAIDEEAHRAAAAAARRVRDALRAPFELPSGVVELSASIGVAALPEHGRDPGRLLEAVDAAVLAARAAGGDAVRSADGGPVGDAKAVVAADDVSEEELAALARALDGDEVRSVFQPIVDLDSGAVVGYEALARGPEGSPVERPDRLFAAAAAAGRLVELEWACRTSAVLGALEARMPSSLALFINVEPSLILAPAPPRAQALLDGARGNLRIVLELTERALTDRPADVLAGVEALRSRGWAIALDDVGADPRSLALMPFVDPEVIKLDLRLVQGNPTPAIAATVHAVQAKAERSGAHVLAEGIETEEQRLTALALGARYAQGWLFGRPGPLPCFDAEQRRRLMPLPQRATYPHASTPFDVVAAHREPREGPKRLLLAISRHLETQALAHGETCVLLSTFQSAEHFTPLTRRRYGLLGESLGFVGALGEGLDGEPAPGVRGASLEEGERLRGEWNVIVLAPHFSAAFVAHDLGDADCEDMERRFDFCLTFDRPLVTRAAEAMMTRVAPRELGALA